MPELSDVLKHMSPDVQALNVDLLTHRTSPVRGRTAAHKALLVAETRVLDMWLPMPPSANVYWRHVGDKVLLSSTARKYRATVHGLAAAQGVVPLTGQVTVTLNYFALNMKSDVDNRIKQLIDALRKVAYGDDKLVRRIVAERVTGAEDRGEPRVYVIVQPYVARVETALWRESD